MGAERQDSREILAILKKGLPQLSLMHDDPMDLGTPFRWLIDHDLKTDKPVVVLQSIVRPNAPAASLHDTPMDVPPVTLIKARHRPLSPKTKVPVEDLYIGIEDGPRLDEAMWSPRMSRDGALI